MEEQYIYLVFSKTGTWLSRVLNIFLATKYVHSSLSFDSTLQEMYSFGRTNPNNPFSGGLVKENLRGGVYKKFRESECLIYRIAVTDHQLDHLKKDLAAFLTEKDKYRYNFLGLFFAFFNKPFKRRHHYFCSQFVSELLINSHIFELDKVPELVKTTDLFQIENKELVYCGYINQFPIMSEVLSFNNF